MYIFSYKDCKDYKDCKTGTHVGGVERNKNTLNRLDFTHFFLMSNLIGRKTLRKNIKIHTENSWIFKYFSFEKMHLNVILKLI